MSLWSESEDVWEVCPASPVAWGAWSRPVSSGSIRSLGKDIVMPVLPGVSHGVARESG